MAMTLQKMAEDHLETNARGLACVESAMNYLLDRSRTAADVEGAEVLLEVEEELLAERRAIRRCQVLAHGDSDGIEAGDGDKTA